MKLQTIIIYIILFVIAISTVTAQVRTVGVTHIEKSTSMEGYNLIFPHFQPNVYLFDQCGRIVHQWDDSSDFAPGNIAYLSESGLLYKAKKPNTIANQTFGAGGAGGIVEVRSWDNELLWTRTWIDTIFRQHHDIAVMPNGNLLVGVWERFVGQDVLDKGAAIPERWTGEEIWSEAIFEIDYINDTIVWEWHAWDHTIQDEDNSKANFGVVADNPEKIDINYAANTVGRPDWLHFNSIAYNSDLDQILISVPHLDEIWILDHSTTSAEAATGTGGNSGKGGGIIYRWGNPESYNRGGDDDRQLFFQHDVNWIEDDIPESSSYKGLISIFNNRVGDSLSVATIIDPMYDHTTNSYPVNNAMNYAPAMPSLSIVHPDTISMYSSGLSSFQVLENDNFLICSGRNGYAFEMDKDQNIFWEYRTPLLRGVPVEQFSSLSTNDNITFKVRRYPLDYLGLSALQVPDDPVTIETNNPSDFCSVLTPTLKIPDPDHLNIYPNPANTFIILDLSDVVHSDIQIFNSLGQAVLFKYDYSSGEMMDISSLEKGLYIVKAVQANAISRIVISQ